MKIFFPLFFATFYGLFVRLFFGFFNDWMGVMSIGFLVLTPVIIGFLTIFFWPKSKIRSRSAAFFMPWVTTLIILVITIVFNIEGTICWVMIYPFFAVVAGLGGILAFKIRKPVFDEKTIKDIEDIGQPNKLNISFALLLLPLAIGFIEGEQMLKKEEISLTKDVIIAAPAAKVWDKLININEIKLSERSMHSVDILGFPQHLQTTLRHAAVGGERVANYENGLSFEETITKYIPEQLMVLNIKVDPNKIPAAVMDDHIVIGGKYVDIQQDSYKLQKLMDGTCRLTLSSNFSINTPINWYVRIWATHLMSDILKGELELIQQRAQNS